MMDDWKLKTSPVVRLERPNERFVKQLKQYLLIFVHLYCTFLTCL